MAIVPQWPLYLSSNPTTMVHLKWLCDICRPLVGRCCTTTKTSHLHTTMWGHGHKSGANKGRWALQLPSFPLFKSPSSSLEGLCVLQTSRDPHCSCPAPLCFCARRRTAMCCVPRTRIYVQHLHLALTSKLCHPAAEQNYTPPPLPIYEEDDCVRGLKVSWRDFVFPYSTLMRCYIVCKCSRFKWICYG